MPSSKSTSTASHAKRGTSTRSASNPAAIKLLMADHKEVKKLFKAYGKLVKDEAGGDEKQALASQICAMLKIHTTIEEEMFYPAAREALSEQDLLDEAQVEHDSAKELISQIESMSPDEELYDAKVTVLGEYVEHHVGEEEGEMFPKLTKAKGLDLDELGQEMVTRKEALMADMGLDAQRH